MPNHSLDGTLYLNNVHLVAVHGVSPLWDTKMWSWNGPVTIADTHSKLSLWRWPVQLLRVPSYYRSSCDAGTTQEERYEGYLPYVGCTWRGDFHPFHTHLTIHFRGSTIHQRGLWRQSYRLQNNGGSHSLSFIEMFHWNKDQSSINHREWKLLISYIGLQVYFGDGACSVPDHRSKASHAPLWGFLVLIEG